MEASGLKRVAPYLELAAFVAAWTTGIALAVQVKPEPKAGPPERRIVANEQPSVSDPLPQHRSFRPIPYEEIQEGG